MPRFRRPVLAAATVVALGVSAGVAAAAPTAPVVTPPPAFVQGTAATASWSPSAFTPLSVDRAYEVEESDMAGGLSWAVVSGGATVRALTGLRDGVPSRIRVRARERMCLLKTLTTCRAWAAGLTYGPWTASPWFEPDATPPSGTVLLDGGRAYTADLDVLFDVSATDAGPAGSGSGVATVEVSHDGAFACQAAGDPGCPVAFPGPSSVRLEDGPDGSRKVHVRFRDAAVPYGTAGVAGNTSVATDTIVLDRGAPDIALGFPSPRIVDAGVLTEFSVAGSTDAVGEVDWTRVRWHLGTLPVHLGARVQVAFTTPGVHMGRVEVFDLAGNRAEEVFSVDVR